MWALRSTEGSNPSLSVDPLSGRHPSGRVRSHSTIRNVRRHRHLDGHARTFLGVVRRRPSCDSRHVPRRLTGQQASGDHGSRAAGTGRGPTAERGRMRRPTGSSWKLVALAGVIVVASGGIGVAAIPSSSDGKITGCYGNSNGQLRVIDAQAGERARTTKRRSRGARPARRVPLAHRAPRVPRGHPVPRASPVRKASPSGAPGPQGVPGPQGDRGPAGPNLIASGVVASSGVVFATQGPVPTVTHVASGQYGISITLGQRCPVPTLSPYQNSDVISWGYGGGCGGGFFASQVRTSSGADLAWSYHFLGEEVSALTARSAESARGGWRRFARARG